MGPSDVNVGLEAQAIQGFGGSGSELWLAIFPMKWGALGSYEWSFPTI